MVAARVRWPPGRRRWAFAFAAAACLLQLALLCCGGGVLPHAGPAWSAKAVIPDWLSAPFRQAADVVVAIALVGWDLLGTLAPGLLAVQLWRAYSAPEPERPTRRFWLRTLGLTVGCLALLRGIRWCSGQWARGGAQQVPGSSRPFVGTGVQSGEEVLQGDGSFVRVADPTSDGTGMAKQGWEQVLTGSMAFALAGGREQVVLMFSRRGDAACDRQLEVLRRTMRERGEAAGRGGLGGGSMLFKPLRVFVLDAAEFPVLVENFGVKVFPTCLVFGAPQVDPLTAAGFVDEDTFDEIVRTAAVREPPAAAGAAGGGWR